MIARYIIDYWTYTISIKSYNWQDKIEFENTFRSWIWSFWLNVAMCPSISTRSHLVVIKHVIKYLKGCVKLDVLISTKRKKSMEVYIKYLVDPTKRVTFADTNCGSCDASVPNMQSPEILLELFKSCSIS